MIPVFALPPPQYAGLLGAPGDHGKSVGPGLNQVPFQ
jgi:hypothetical protein